MISLKFVGTRCTKNRTVHNRPQLIPEKSRTRKFPQFLTPPCSRSLSELITDGRNLNLQNREVSVDNILNLFQLYSQVIVYDHIAESTDLSPRHLRILELRTG